MKKTTTNFKSLCFVLTLLLGFNLSAQGDLKELANNKNVYIGNLANGGFINTNFSGNANTQFTNEYNVMVTENAFKASSLIPNRPQNFPEVSLSDINVGVLDKVMKYSEDKTLRLRGHALVWFNSTSLPSWFSKVDWTADNVYRFSKSYITTVVNHTKGRVDEWDVLNEAIQDGNGAFRLDSQVWYSAVRTQTTSNNITESGQRGFIDYFANLFKWARAADPGCKLFYNDFSINGTNTAKADFMFQMVKDLQAKGAPIDGVGFQSHMTVADFDSGNLINQVRANMQRLANIGLDVAVTEADIRACVYGNETNFANTGPLPNADDRRQAYAYRDYVQLVLEQPNCNTFLVWGQTDGESWISSSGMQSNPSFKGCHRSTLHNGNYSAKWAYTEVRNVVNNLPLQTAELPIANDEILSITAPNSVEKGSNATVTVDYSAATNRDIVVILQNPQSPWNDYGAPQTASVLAGSGSLTFNVPVYNTNSVPTGNNVAKFQVILTQPGGGWANRIDNFEKNNVNITALPTQAIANGTYLIKKSSQNAYLNARAASGSINNTSNANGSSVKWNFIHLGNEEYEIRSTQYGTRLEIPYGRTGRRQLVATTTWNGSADNLIWVAVRVGNNFQFLPKHDQARALDIYEGRSDIVHLWDKNQRNANQIFTLVPSSTNLKVAVASLNLDSAVAETITKGFYVYPNPAAYEVNLTSATKFKGDVIIVNLAGQVVYKAIIKEATNTHTVNISSFSAGMYYLKTALGSKKFIKK